MEGPVSVNTTVNSINNFTCTTSTDAGSAEWDVTGIDQNNTQFESQNIHGGRIHAMLSISIKKEYDIITVACRVRDENGHFLPNQPPEALVMIQGLLDLPGNLTVLNTSSSDIKLTWTPPFTLDITDVDPDISSYTAYITNTKTGNTGTVSVTEFDENGVVETEYTFTGLPGEDPDPCHVYQFSVSAWNVVGEGGRSEPVDGWFLGAPSTITNLTIEMSLLFAKQPEINSFLTVEISCPGRLPDELKYRVVSTTHNESFLCSVSDIKPDGSLECSISDNVLIDANSKYSVEVTAENEVGRSLPAVRNFSTFDVQTVVIETTPDNGTVEVTCFFAEDSQAKGCRVDFLSQEGNTICSMTIDKGSGSQANGTFELPNGTYEILVYDVEVNGSLSENPAYQHDEIVIILGSSVSEHPECKGSDDREIDSGEEESGAIIAGSLGAIIVVVTVGIAAALLICKRKRLICKRKRKEVKAVEPNLDGTR